MAKKETKKVQKSVKKITLHSSNGNTLVLTVDLLTPSLTKRDHLTCLSSILHSLTESYGLADYTATKR